MVPFSAEVLKVDPGIIATGSPAEAEKAQAVPDPQSPACQSALFEFRTAEMFRILFTAVAFLLTLSLAVLLAYGFYQSIKHKVDAKAIIAFAGGAASGVAMAFVVKRMNESIQVTKNALNDVKTYCGVATKQQLTA